MDKMDILKKLVIPPSVKIPNKILPQSSGNEELISLQEMRKTQKQLVEEKAKFYSYLGMEVYDMHAAGADLPDQVFEFCSKLDEITKNLDRINSGIEQKENMSKKNHICECGTKLNKGIKFCPTCGKPTPFAPIICACGEQVEKGVKFCPSCGKSIEAGTPKKIVNSVETIACVCGEEVNVSQLMCMKCGRRVTAN